MQLTRDMNAMRGFMDMIIGSNLPDAIDCSKVSDITFKLG